GVTIKLLLIGSGNVRVGLPRLDILGKRDRRFVFHLHLDEVGDRAEIKRIQLRDQPVLLWFWQRIEEAQNGGLGDRCEFGAKGNKIGHARDGKGGGQKLAMGMVERSPCMRSNIRASGRASA